MTLTDLLRACGALRPGGQLAEHVDEETRALAESTLDKIHRRELSVSDEDRETLLASYWSTVTKILFPGAVSFYRMPQMLVRQRAGEAFEAVPCDPIAAHNWPVAGSA